jgi:hypothetical protein
MAGDFAADTQVLGHCPFCREEFQPEDHLEVARL